MSRWLLAAPALFLGVFFLWPLVQVLAAVDVAGLRWVADDYVRRHLALALQQALWSVALTFAFAIPLAWHHHRRAIPWSRWHLALHAAPFILPVFVVVGAARAMLGPHGWLSGWLGVDLLAVLGPMGAVVLAHAYYNYGLAARLLHGALQRRPHRLEEAARVLGASPVAAFRRVSLPLLWPAAAATALLVFLFTFTSFGVVLLLGHGQIQTLETLIYQNLQGVRIRWNRAAALGVVQLAINVVVLLAYFRLQRRAVPAEPARQARARRRDVALAWAALAAALVPVVSVLAGGFRVAGTWSLEAWRSLLDAGHPAHKAGFDLLQAIDRSLFYAFWSAVLSTLLVLLLAYGRGRSRRWIEAIGALPLGTSSVLVGLGLLLAFGSGDVLDLRGTLIQVVIAHTLIAFPFVARAFVPALDLHDRRLDEAAMLLGADRWAVLRRVHWPLLRAPLLVGVGFAVAISFGDFGASLLLMRADNVSLAVWIGRHDEPFRAIAHAQMLALSSVLMVMATAAYLLVERFRKVGA